MACLAVVFASDSDWLAAHTARNLVFEIAINRVWYCVGLQATGGNGGQESIVILKLSCGRLPH